MKPAAEKNIFRMFEILLLMRGVTAISEIIGAISIFFIPHETILYYINLLVQSEFMASSSHDSIATHLLLWAQNFSISTRNFTFFYLISHGTLKLWLIVGLLKQTLWYYPTAIIIFSLLVSYQMYRFSFTHSIILFCMTFIDIIVIGLTWHEYRYLSSQKVDTAKK